VGILMMRDDMPSDSHPAVIENGGLF